MAFVIGVDTGGTFTDGVAIDDEGVLTSAKALSTPPDFSRGVLNALDSLAERLGLTAASLLERTQVFCLGTTVATNTILTRTGSATGLLTTKGFEDTLNIARGMSQWAGLPEGEAKHQAAHRKPTPLSPRRAIKGVTERVDSSGSVVVALNRDEVRKQIQELLAEGVESIGVCYLWSVRNGEHEDETRELIKELAPNVYCTTSAAISPALGELERFNTTALDAYVGPVTQRFLDSLEQSLKDTGFGHRLSVMKANGGVTFGAEVLPFATISSGPAGGVAASKILGDLLGCENIITTDVGGTSFDVSLIWQGSSMYARQPVVGQWPVAFPMVDISSIGAGGGSIAWVNPITRRLHVGPRSAGASPGPACYGFGGEEPTIIDASLVLGHLNPDNFLGGRMRLDRDKAFTAVDRIAKPLGLDVVEAASAVHTIANSHMADLIRRVTIQRGYDPRDFTLFAFGGAGPMHAAFYGADLGVKQVVVPFIAAVHSAFGVCTASHVYSRMLFDYHRLPVDPEVFNRNFGDLEAAANADLQNAGIPPEDRSFNYFLEMRYGLQYHVVRVTVPRKRYTSDDMELVTREFDRTYEALFGSGAGYSRAGRFIFSFIVEGVGEVVKTRLTSASMDGPDASAAKTAKRRVVFPGNHAFTDADVYLFQRLNPGNVMTGPAIVEAEQTTIVIPPEVSATVDQFRNVVMQVSR